MKLDTSQPGLQALYRPHEAEILKHLWEVAKTKGTAKNTRYAYLWQVANLPKLGLNYKSRATVINFMNQLVDEGVLNFREDTGKGGYHRLYWIRRTPANFEKYVRKTIAAKLDEIFGVNEDG